MVNFMESYVDALKINVDRLRVILSQYDVNFCVLGGASLLYHGFNRTTDDIDILVDNTDKDELLHIPPSYLRDVSNGGGRVFMLEGSVKIEVIYTGDMLNGNKGTPYPIPDKISHDNIIDLYYLIYFKIEAQMYNAENRYYDFGDVINLIKENNLPEDYMYQSTMDIDDKYKELWKVAMTPTMFNVE